MNVGEGVDVSVEEDANEPAWLREGAKQEEKNVKTEKVVNSEKGGGGGTEDHQALRENKHKDTQSVNEGTNKTGNTNTFKQTD